MFEVIRRLMVNGNEIPDYPNTFYPVSDEEISECESRLGYQLPEQLRMFLQEVGYGFFVSASPENQTDRIFYINRFLDPSSIADLMLDEEEESRPSEGFDDGVIPFFEVGDQLYIVLRPSRSNRYQVTWPHGDIICKDLVEFTERLAKNPRFYHD